MIIFEGKIKTYFDNKDETRRTLLLPPLPFHAVNSLFEYMQNIQELLSSLGVSVKTHAQLLSKINSRLANHYSLAREKTQKALDCFKHAAGHGYLRGKGHQQEYFTSQLNFKTQMEDMGGKTEEQKRSKIGIKKKLGSRHRDCERAAD